MRSYITWKDAYSVGNETLDAQHRQIIGIINDLYEAIQQDDDSKAIKPLLNRLVQYTTNHFQQEEKFLAEHEYPDFVYHKMLHDKMRRETLAWRDNADIVTGRDLLRFLKEWWCNHIQQEDKKYTPYLATLVGV